MIKVILKNIKIHVAIIGATNSLKIKLIEGTLKEVALRWYMSLQTFSIISLFQGYYDTMKEYLSGFNEETVRSPIQTKRCL